MEEIQKEIERIKFIETIRDIESRRIGNFTKCIRKFYVLARGYNPPEADEIMLDFFNETFMKDLTRD